MPILDDAYNNIFGSGNIGPAPSLLIWTAVFVAIGTVVLRKTPYGRQALATSGNESAARFSGVKTLQIKLLVLTVSGMVAALAGMLYAGRLHSGRFQFGLCAAHGLPSFGGSVRRSVPEGVRRETWQKRRTAWLMKLLRPRWGWGCSVTPSFSAKQIVATKPQYSLCVLYSFANSRGPPLCPYSFKN